LKAVVRALMLAEMWAWQMVGQTAAWMVRHWALRSAQLMAGQKARRLVESLVWKWAVQKGEKRVVQLVVSLAC
jgi:hypothetical protein